MQALSLQQSAFTGAAAPRAAARRQQRQQQQRRGGSLVVRADVGFCRDKISDRRDMMDEIEGTSTVIFLGANGEEIPVECPKVRPQLRGASGQAARKGAMGGLAAGTAARQAAMCFQIEA